MFGMVACLLLFALISLSSAQSGCSCQQNLVLDPSNQCFNISSDLQSARYTCPVGGDMYCGSLYCLEFFSCGEAGALAARRTACEAIGGNPDSVDFFKCQTQLGSDKSEENCQFAPPLSSTPAPTVSIGPGSNPTTTTTNSPTSSTTRLFVPMIVFLGLLCLFVLL